MRLLVVRTEGEAFARRLEEERHEALLEPLIAIAPLEPPPAIDLSGVQAIALTSRNAATLLARAIEARDLPVFTVGDATATAAREAGFTAVESAQGDGRALTRLLEERLDPAAGAILHASGERIAYDLAEALEPDGYEVQRVVLYRGEAAGALSPATTAALREGRLEAVAFFSPAGAETFVRLVRAAELTETLAPLKAFALSPAVAAPLLSAGFAAVRSAAAPTAEALLALLRAENAGQPKNEGMTDAAADPPTPAALPALPPAEPERRPPGWLARLGAWLPGFLLGGLVFLAGYLAAVGTSDYWQTERQAPEMQGAVEQRLAALETKLAAVPEPPDLSAVEAAVSKLEAELAAMSEKLPAGGDDALAALESRIDERLRQGESALAQIKSELDETRKSLADLEATLAATPQPAGEAAAEPVEDGRVAALDQRLMALEASAGLLAKRLERLESALATVNETLAEQAATAPDQTVSLALAIAELKAAALAGRAYSEALTVVQALAGGYPALADPLRTLAKYSDGVATRDALAKELSEAAGAIIAADAVGSGDGSLLDEALGGLGDLVSIRPVGEVEGEGAAARVARAEQRLVAGDLAAAIAEIEGLQAAAAEQAAAWLVAAKGRHAVEEALGALSASVTAGLGKAR